MADIQAKIQDFVSLESFQSYLESLDNSLIAPGVVDFLDANWAHLGDFDDMGYRTTFTSIWGRLVAGGKAEIKPHEGCWLVGDLLNVDVAFDIGITNSKEPAEGRYTKFCEWANSGFLQGSSPNGKILFCPEGRECGRSGLKIHPVFLTPFSVTLHARNPETYQLEAVKPYAPPGVQHVEFNCPSGEILIADWIRIPALSKLYRDNADYSSKLSINHDAGSIADTKRTMELFGLLDIHLSNMAVELFQRDGILVIGDSWSDLGEQQAVCDGYRRVGDICTDRWSLTAIDRQVLEALLADVVDDPAQEIARCLSENDVLVQHWKPGTYHVYFSGDYSQFQQEFSEIDFELPGLPNVYAVISDRELGPKNKSRPRVAPR